MTVEIDMSEVQRWGGLMQSEIAAIGQRISGAVGEEQAIVVAKAKAAAPKLTHALEASIRPLGKGLSRRVRAGNNKAFYARFQEFGTRKMAANPFLVVQANFAEQTSFERIVDRAINEGEIYA